jgi:AcrR family transcriptional regulator
MSAHVPSSVESFTPLMREAAWWRLTGLLFERPHGEWWSEVRALGAEVDDPDLVEAARLAFDASEEGYLSTLGPSGIVSPRQAGHDGRRDPGHVLAEIASYYEAFAYRPATEDTDDHVAVEAGFVGYLHLKQAYALVNGEAEAAELAARAARAFIESHLTAMSVPLADALQHAETRYLAAAARALGRKVGDPPAARGPKVFWMEEDSPTCAGQP